MAKIKINKVKLKAFVDLSLLIVFPIAAVSGIILGRLPSGGYRGGRGIIGSSFLGIDHYTWRTIHYNSHLLFVLLVVIHLTLSWDFLKNLPKLIKTYIQELKK
ncbi:hypothetical protein AMJ51_00710 [Microgenomates bacterium DG_75]|nr:MAG: hypothetical protein AMJ51_00710 [Microgenomates bacterium DG_75]